MTPRTEPRDNTNQEFTEALDKLIKQHYREAKDPKDLLRNGGLLKNMIKHVVERCLEAEMETHLGYAKDERAGMSSEKRRNGYSKKTVTTDQGELTLGIPRDRNGEFEPQAVPKRQTRLEGFDDKVLAMYPGGMTVRDIQSQLVFFDALMVKVRENQRVINKAVYLTLAVNTSGQKELLGIWISQNEGAKFWLGILTELKNPGVQDILIACVDGLTILTSPWSGLFSAE